MHTINRTINGIPVFGESYSSPTELLTVLGSRSLADACLRDFFPDEYRNYDDFYGFETGKQCKEDFVRAKCDPSILKAIQGDQPTSVRKTEFFHDVVGFKPIVPLALMNQPKAMFNQRTVLVKAKVINLHISITAHCGYTIEQLAKAGKTVIEYIWGLELEGYRVSLTVYFAVRHNRGLVYMGLKVKDASQPLDISRCAYPFINPSFFRGIGFMWYQRTSGFDHDSHYGWPFGRGSDWAGAFEQALPRENRIVLYLADIMDNGKEGLDKALAEIKKNQYKSL